MRSVRVVPTLLGAFEDLGGARFRLVRVVGGEKFVFAEVEGPDGDRFGGLASARRVPAGPWPSSAAAAAALCASEEPRAAAVGLATINAVLNRPFAETAPGDGVEWLLVAGRGRHVAFIGRFPFIEDEVRPHAAKLSVFEIEPRDGELGAADMPAVLPTADVIAVTATSILNRTLGRILEHRSPSGRVLLLGPSTPLTPALFELGVDRLAGIVVRDLDRVATDVRAGVSFRKVGGTARITVGHGGAG